MRVGVPKETKNNESRVALTPAGAMELVTNGHQVFVEAGAGEGSSISDEQYREAGATILESAQEVWEIADLVLKVKEPIPSEYPFLRPGQILFTYLHLAASKGLTEALMASGVTAVAYETVQLPDRSLPLLIPMSEVAGSLAPQLGSYFLTKPQGGRGILLGGVTATRRAKTVVIGGGAAGEQAAKISLGLGSDVTIIDISIPRLKQLEDVLGWRVQTRTSNVMNITEAVKEADLVIGSVLVPGARTPKLVTEEMVRQMKPGSVLVDIAIDQGGCFELSKPTTHDDPVYKVHGSLYYSVTNMPGAVPETATYALTNATLPYVVKLANHGWEEVAKLDPALARGLNVYKGKLIHPGVIEAFPELS